MKDKFVKLYTVRTRFFDRHQYDAYHNALKPIFFDARVQDQLILLCPHGPRLNVWSYATNNSSVKNLGPKKCVKKCGPRI